MRISALVGLAAGALVVGAAVPSAAPKRLVVVPTLGLAKGVQPIAGRALEGSDQQALMAAARNANDRCRGSSGDSPTTIAACAERDRLWARLRAIGWCHGRRGELGYQQEWLRCGPDSAATPPASAAPRVGLGPSFDCTSPAAAREPLPQLICMDAGLARLDLAFIQAFQALRQQVGEAGLGGLRREAADFQSAVVQGCGISRSGAATPDLLARARGCIDAAYRDQHRAWLARLDGAALQEAERPLERHVGLQRALQKLGHLPESATVDGVYGPATRAAIMAWQQAEGFPANPWISDRDAAALAAADTGAEATDSLHGRFEAEAGRRPDTLSAAVADRGAAHLVFFDKDRSDLTPRAKQIIAQVAARAGGQQIEVLGHDDRLGTPEIARYLSRQRAEVVAAELARHGVSWERISVQALGDSRPLVPSVDGVAEPQNRRVELTLAEPITPVASVVAGAATRLAESVERLAAHPRSVTGAAAPSAVGEGIPAPSGRGQMGAPSTKEELAEQIAACDGWFWFVGSARLPGAFGARAPDFQARASRYRNAGIEMAEAWVLAGTGAPVAAAAGAKHAEAVVASGAFAASLPLVTAQCDRVSQQHAQWRANHGRGRQASPGTNHQANGQTSPSLSAQDAALIGRNKVQIGPYATERDMQHIVDVGVSLFYQTSERHLRSCAQGLETMIRAQNDPMMRGNLEYHRRNTAHTCVHESVFPCQVQFLSPVCDQMFAAVGRTYVNTR